VKHVEISILNYLAISGMLLSNKNDSFYTNI